MGRRKYSKKDLAEMVVSVRDQATAYYATADDETRAAGIGWYPIAHQEAQLIAETFDISTSRAAAIIAVLSPLTRWQGNLEDAWNLFEYDACQHALPTNVRKARRLVAGEAIADVLGGKKVTAFWQNITDPLDPGQVTTNDSWIARAFGINEREIFSTWGVYEAVSAGLALAAEQEGILPSVMQATVWLAVRNAPDAPDLTLDNPW